MYLIVAVDDRNGMMFNGRRQSRDKDLCKKILRITDKNRLWMNNYTASLFRDYEGLERILVDDEFLGKAGKKDYCFVENALPDEINVEKIVLFKWNRKYPGDFYFDFDLSSWKLAEVEELAGNSHEKITMEVYVR